MARARKPFLTSKESSILFRSYVSPTKAQEEQALKNILLKFAKKKYLSNSDRVDYLAARLKFCDLQNIDEEQYQRAREKIPEVIKKDLEWNAKYEPVAKVAAWIIGGLLLLFFLTALGF